MVLAQIYVSNASKNNYLMGALNGRYKVKLISTHYIDTGANNNHKWIQLISSKLNMGYGAQRYFTFVNKADHVIQHGDIDFGEIDVILM
jgi:hypothetical protein